MIWYNTSSILSEVFGMFLKSTKSKGYEYLSLVESVWEEGTTRHHTLFQLGRADLLRNDPSFQRILSKLNQIMGISNGTFLPSDCSEATMKNYGYLAYAQLWEDLGIAKCLEGLSDQKKVTFPLSETAFLMAVQHLLRPASKLSTYEGQAVYYRYQEIPLHTLYRTLDHLYAHKEIIEDELFQENHTRAGQTVDVVFYDVTTFAFESVQKDELKNFGISKSGKFNEVQVVMGLLMNSEGLPIGYELFPGNTFDGKTMIQALENIRKRFGIHRVVIVADRGLNSHQNLLKIREAGYGYIVAGRIKSLAKQTQEAILSPEGYTDAWDEEGDAVKIKVLEMNRVVPGEDKTPVALPEHLILSYSERRAKKDRADRERLVEKARKMLAHPGQITAAGKRGGKKYLTGGKTTDVSWELDEERIAEDALWDGYYGIETSETHRTPQQVREAYHTLWKIEESFRIMKSTLEVRPIFHWTPRRIHGHFLVCFLSFLMERNMERLLTQEKKTVPVSPERIREALLSMQLAQVTVGDTRYWIRTANASLGNTIFKKLKLKTPKNISTDEELAALFALTKKKSWWQLSLF